MAWQAGKSGNPNGRPPNVGRHAELRALLQRELPDVLAALVAQARSGDTAAIKLILDRTLPPLRPIDAPGPFALPAEGGLSEQGQAVLLALAAGHLPANQATSILQALVAQAKLHETDELERRIAALEAKPG